MLVTPRISKFILTLHITFSVGWLGAVAVFLCLAIIGVTTQNNQLARAAYLAMEKSGWFVIVPFCIASLITGIVLSLSTKWGLFKHYWIIIKIFLTVVATILLLFHMQPVSMLAGLASNNSFSSSDSPRLRIQLIADAGGAILLLMVAVIISVYKPWGKTKYGLRESIRNNPGVKINVRTAKKSWGYFVLIALISLVVLFIILHIFGGGIKHH